MGRPRLHDTDALLDAALALAAERGPARITMSGVAKGAGAPSGTVYNRFDGRPALLAALWLRTVGRFQTGYLAALARDPAPDGCRAAAVHVVAWSRRDPAAAGLLLRGARECGRDEWPEAARSAALAAQQEITGALRAAAARLGPSAGGYDRVVLAVVDVPYAVVRRHLAAGGAIPARAERLVADAVDALLA